MRIFVGWIRIHDTNIDYPIVISKDNTEYRNYDYKKEYSITGSIFMDYRNDRYFKDDYTIIYGHNLKKDLMFAEVKNFADKEYFDEHLTGLLYAENVIYKIEIGYYESLNAYSKPYSLLFYKNGSNDKLLEEFDNNVINRSGVEINSDDKLILLSTCNSSDTETRSVLVGKLVEINESEIINEKDNITLNEIDKQLSDREKYDSVKKIVKDNEEIKTNSRFIYVAIGVIIILILLFILRFRRTRKEKTLKKKGKHMK